ncbi:MAG: terminase large subunit [Pseudomonadales bacterium]|nr:terminase large subunit [Pseudomonadales bacterium]
MQDLILSAPQHIFLAGLNTKYRAYVGGFGSGKTFIGCIDLLNFFGLHPGTRQGYFGPSYPSIRDIFFPTFEEAALMLGFTVDIKEANKEVHVYRAGRYYGTVICRSMDRPSSIVGFKISRALVDEIDTLTKDKAESAWNKIIARLRLVIDGVQNGIGVTTTPEGFLFVYEKFACDPTPSYSMVQASTYENQEFLPPDYIPTLLETYPDALANAYIRGKFVNLKSGTVYYVYDRLKHHSDEQIKPKEPLYVGMDFNVGKMAATIFVRRGDNQEKWHAVAELFDLFDTPTMITTLQERYPDHQLFVYPDSSGDSRKTVAASTSDIALLQQAGFVVRAKETNPFVKDRVLSLNAALEKGKLYVNEKNCPVTARCLEQQAYDDNGEPDKKSGHDHQNDATGYAIAYEMPVRKPVANIVINSAY